MDPKPAADNAVRAASALLTGTSRDGVKVASMFWYGAVDVGIKHLVVWILLSAAPDDDLPEWYFPVRGQRGGIQAQLTPSLREWLNEMRDVVHAEFAKVGWPNPYQVSVGFDSSNRVNAQVAIPTSGDARTRYPRCTRSIESTRKQLKQCRTRTVAAQSNPSSTHAPVRPSGAAGEP